MVDLKRYGDPDFGSTLEELKALAPLAQDISGVSFDGPAKKVGAILALAGVGGELIADIEALSERLSETRADLVIIQEERDSARYNASAFEDRMGNLQGENGKLRDETQRQRERHRTTWTQLERAMGLLRGVMKRCAKEHGGPGYVGKDGQYLKEIRAALSQQAEPSTSCKWVRDEDTGAYDTACGVTWHLSDGGEPEEHGQYYCHHCGKQIDDEGVSHE